MSPLPLTPLPGLPATSTSTLMAVHGFGGSPLSFAEIGNELPLRAVTLPGHDGVPVGSFNDAADRLAATTTAATVLWGYSLGARLALAAAARTPLRALILESGRGDVDGFDRVRLDDERAAVLARDGKDAFFAGWDNGPLFVHLDESARAQRARLRERHSAEGLAAALRAFSPGRQPPVDLDLVRVPVLLLAGARDSASVSRAKILHMRWPRSRLHVLPESGHQPHIEDRTGTVAAVATFLKSLDAPAPADKPELRS